MRQAIVGYHKDEEDHWVAELACRHNQHVRHDPPWVDRPWVTTAAGRKRMLGYKLDCKKCDRGEPPDRHDLPNGQTSGAHMEQRFKYHFDHPGIKALRQLEAHLHNCSIEMPILELVKMRASQINGCAYCLDMHSKDARAAGEDEQRLHVLAGWREAPFYSDRERAALAWTEAVTRVADTHVPNGVYEQAKKQFSDEELLDLTLAVSAINTWNRLSISSRTPAGSYKPAKK